MKLLLLAVLVVIIRECCPRPLVGRRSDTGKTPMAPKNKPGLPRSGGIKTHSVSAPGPARPKSHQQPAMPRKSPQTPRKPPKPPKMPKPPGVGRDKPPKPNRPRDHKPGKPDRNTGRHRNKPDHANRPPKGKPSVENRKPHQPKSKPEKRPMDKGKHNGFQREPRTRRPKPPRRDPAAAPPPKPQRPNLLANLLAQGGGNPMQAIIGAIQSVGQILGVPPANAPPAVGAQVPQPGPPLTGVGGQNPPFGPLGAADQMTGVGGQAGPPGPAGVGPMGGMSGQAPEPAGVDPMGEMGGQAGSPGPGGMGGQPGLAGSGGSDPMAPIGNGTSPVGFPADPAGAPPNGGSPPTGFPDSAGVNGGLVPPGLDLSSGIRGGSMSTEQLVQPGAFGADHNGTASQNMPPSIADPSGQGLDPASKTPNDSQNDLPGSEMNQGAQQPALSGVEGQVGADLAQGMLLPDTKQLQSAAFPVPPPFGVQNGAATPANTFGLSQPSPVGPARRSKKKKQTGDEIEPPLFGIRNRAATPPAMDLSRSPQRGPARFAKKKKQTGDGVSFA